MFKKLTVLCIILGSLFSIILPVNVYASEINININNQPVRFVQDSGKPFLDQANRTQVPFRLTMESFGCSVSWNNENQTAIAEKNGTIITVPIGESYIMKDGQKITNDTAALIKDSHTYLPIRAALEAFGAFVEWQPDTQSVMVSTIDPNKIMTVHFLDVGQADSIFIDMGSYEILIDGGNNADGTLVVNYLEPYVDGNLELIVATHAHEDHIGGLDNVISAYQIDTILYSEETSTTLSFQDFYNTAISEPNCKLIGDQDMTFDLSYGAQFKILEMGDGFKYPNENSVVSMLDYNDIEVLFMGDLDAAKEENNLGKFSDIDLLKVGHHGSRTSSSQAFLDIIKPDVSIISAGLANKYSLPSAEIISRLLSVNSSVYGTFHSGSIVMTTDGGHYSLSTNILLTPEDAGAGAVVK